MSTTANYQIIQRRVEEIWNQGKLATIDRLIDATLISAEPPVGAQGSGNL